MAVGNTRSWSSVLAGVGAAVLAPRGDHRRLGTALRSPLIDELRAVIGILLLVFGLQWLRKAILRAAGMKALHDEREAYAHEITAARAKPTGPRCI